MVRIRNTELPRLEYWLVVSGIPLGILPVCNIWKRGPALSSGILREKKTFICIHVQICIIISFPKF